MSGSELQKVLADLRSPGVWFELGVLFACIGVAYLFTRWLAYRFALAAAVRVRDQRLAQGVRQAQVIHDQTARFVCEDAVDPRNRLH